LDARKYLMRSLRVLVLVAMTTMCRAAQAQDAALVPDTTLPIPTLRFDANGALVILASATSVASWLLFTVRNGVKTDVTRSVASCVKTSVRKRAFSRLVTQ
jgi:hypothetical protein